MTLRRRDFISLLGGVAAVWPLAARAQQLKPVRRIGVLMSLRADDPDGQAEITAFAQGLQELGWAVGRNARIDYRWGAGDLNLFRQYAAELVALAPDVVLASGSVGVAALQEASRTVPIVFVTTVDPVGAGLVENLARPGTNASGFTSAEFSLSGKLLDVLKQVAPAVTRVVVLRDAAVPAGTGGFASIQTVARSLGVEPTPIGVRDAGEIERGIEAFARRQNGGLVVVGPVSSMTRNLDLVVTLAARYRLPAVYNTWLFIRRGGLLVYAADSIDQYRRAAAYIDRILKGENPADLPVQAPNKYSLVINLKTAKVPGLTVPPSLLAIADEVIE